MLRKTAIAALLAAMGATDAKAQTGETEARKGVQPYIAFRFSFENADANQFIFDNGYGGIGAVGLNIRDRFRVELSVSRRGSDIIGVPPIRTEGYFRAWAWLLNAYYHPWGVDRRISPYAALGGGFNHATVRATSIDTEPHLVGLGFPEQRYVQKAWQGKLGVATRLRRDLYLDLEGAYFVSDDQDIVANFPNNEIVESAYRTYSFLIGLRHNF